MDMPEKEWRRMMYLFEKYCKWDKTRLYVEIVSYPPKDEEVEELEQLVYFYNRFNNHIK
ncbi:MAG: hypothetical protein LBH05_07830 [Deferribacteraceae bacterium]|jgi:hypothetical protein|nr:hypothetical protein [Deferribacteraceae bacterium]